MIQATQLTKRYGSTTAIQEVSFEVNRGEILGFLGPNGAGKTTTMRILSGFFAATEGKATIAGFDVFEDPLEVKKRVGYLPENPPLYGEMKVDAYLRFVATIKGVEASSLDSQLSHSKERCGLTKVGDRLIKQLSKGYRQRVGLAQAIIHDPEVLILDEPTSGLDPKQIIEVRELIKSLGGDHTVILSTHILSEVSMTCERVIIIDKGEIVAMDTPENLTRQAEGEQRLELEIVGPVENLTSLLREISPVKNVITNPPEDKYQRVFVEVEKGEEVRHLVARKVVDAGFELYGLKAQSVTLEEVFVNLTADEKEAVVKEDAE